MAILLPPGSHVVDDAGAPVNGGKFRVYEAGTTTYADLFSDEPGGTPRANPVVANSAGELPFFFVESGTYDVAFLSAADVVIHSADDVPAWGEDTGDFSRTVAGSGRIEITGAAGAVLIRAKSPSPDETGGNLTVEGAAGTQLDTLTLDSSSTALTGDLTIKGGKKLAGHVATAATTFTTVSSLDIALVEDPDGVRAWRIDLFDITTTETGGNALTGRLSYDNGATYKSGASDYYYVHVLTIAASATASGSTAATQMVVAPSFETATNHPGVLTLEVITPDSGNNATIVRVQGEYTDPGSAIAPAMSRGFARGLGSYGRATHIRIIAASGQTITGKYRVMPLYGFGE